MLDQNCSLTIRYLPVFSCYYRLPLDDLVKYLEDIVHLKGIKEFIQESQHQVTKASESLPASCLCSGSSHLYIPFSSQVIPGFLGRGQWFEKGFPW